MGLSSRLPAHDASKRATDPETTERTTIIECVIHGHRYRREGGEMDGPELAQVESCEGIDNQLQREDGAGC